MIYGYARVSTDGHGVAAQVATLTDAGAANVYRETAKGDKTNRAQLHRLLNVLEEGKQGKSKGRQIAPAAPYGRSCRLFNGLAPGPWPSEDRVF